MLGELEQAMGITSRHLTDFHPGVDDARLRLQWASTRCTTWPEDIAYLLLGVFSLHIPVLYGESAENALGRLLAEVISKSGDTSILDWVGQSLVFHRCFPATIIPYEAPPLSLPDLPTPPSTGRIRKFLFIKSARKMHQALSSLPLTKFRRWAWLSLILHCRRGSKMRRKEPHVLIRPWHPNFNLPSILDLPMAHMARTAVQCPFIKGTTSQRVSEGCIDLSDYRSSYGLCWCVERRG